MKFGTSNKTSYVAALVAVGALAASPTAFACGGLFCSAAAPVEQTAERILFADEGDGRTTTIIEIQYEGPSEKFAWLLPIAGVPEVAVSSAEVFNALQRYTEPSFRVRSHYSDSCALDYAYDDDAADDGSVFADAGVSEEPGITVLDSGVTGPYQHVTISADPDLDDPAAAAVEWLDDNDYDVGEIGADVLRPYLESGLNLIAFRLTKTEDAGSIVPIQLTYDGPPTIPLRPTAAAAVDDMAIRVFLLGDDRALSQNYLGVELNLSRVDWSNASRKYDQLVSEAVDEAGGQAFVTEFAGDSEAFDGRIYYDYLDENWESLQTSEATGARLLQEAAWAFRQFEGYRRAVAEAVTLPEGVTLDDFASDPFGYESGGSDAGEGVVRIDDPLFLTTLESDVIAPLKAAQKLVDEHKVLSRLFTTLSPDEMLRSDPTFLFVKDLPDVSNLHTADLRYLCTAEQEVADAVTLLELDNGWVVPGKGGVSNRGVSELPAASVVYREGSLEVLEDHNQEIADALADLLEEETLPEFVEPGEGDDDASGSDAGVDQVGNTEGDDQSADTSAKPDDDAADDDAADDDAANEKPRTIDDRAADAGVVDSRRSSKDDGGCSIVAPGTADDSAWLFALLGLPLLRRRRH